LVGLIFGLGSDYCVIHTPRIRFIFKKTETLTFTMIFCGSAALYAFDSNWVCNSASGRRGETFTHIPKPTFLKPEPFVFKIFGGSAARAAIIRVFKIM